MIEETIDNPRRAKNPNMSKEQVSFEKWAKRNHLSLQRNFYVLYAGTPRTYKNLFGDITENDYYIEPKTQGAWNGWRARRRVHQ